MDHQPDHLDDFAFDATFGLKSKLFEHVSAKIKGYLVENTHKVAASQREWEQFFGNIHRKADMIDDLFVKHAYLFLLVLLTLCRRFLPGKSKDIPRLLGLIRQSLQDREIELNGTIYYGWVESVPSICEMLDKALQQVEFSRGDLFFAIYQGMTSPAARHALGEFYTPPSLVNLMLQRLYQPGMCILDPACGSGTFLVEVIRKFNHPAIQDLALIELISNLYGFDIHPLAILVTKANLLLQFDELPARPIPVRIYQMNALFPDPEFLSQICPVRGFDLVIGNPPWLVLNGIESEEYKVKVKNLARELGVMRGGRFATHTELTALFYYRCRDLWLKENGWIFFVATAGFMSGDQHARFRQFKGFGNPFAWRFDEDIFRVHNICLGLQKVHQELQERLRIKVTNFQCQDSNGIWTFHPKTEQIYVPYNLSEITSEEDPVRRLIPEKEVGQLLPQGPSPYFGKFYQGASLVPRTLIFAIVEKEDKEVVTIAPDMNVQAKPPWDFQPYDHARVEQEYIHPVAKSTEIVPYKLVSTKLAFIPRDHSHLKPLARAHFAFLDTLYKERQKRGATITDLWSRLDYNHGLATPRQNQERKVIFRGIGGYTQAAIVGREVIVDTSCYFYPAESDGEAYYLLTVLNSLQVSHDLRRRGSTGAGGSLRNLHKKPLEYNIPKYNEANPTHTKLAVRGHEMAAKVETLIHDWQQEELLRAQKREDMHAKKEGRKPQMIQVNDVLLRPHSIHNRILKDLAKDFEQLDILVVNLIKNQ